MSRLQKEQFANKISLMTIHKSKGLEFPIVYLLCAIEGNMPHSSALDASHLDDVKMAGVAGRDKGTAALEEERRLAYVAVTRAKAELLISSPAFYRGKKAEPSRFLLSAFPGADPVVQPQACWRLWVWVRQRRRRPARCGVDPPPRPSGSRRGSASRPAARPGHASLRRRKRSLRRRRAPCAAQPWSRAAAWFRSLVS